MPLKSLAGCEHSGGQEILQWCSVLHFDGRIAPQDVHADISSNNSNGAASNSLISSGLKFRIVLFLVVQRSTKMEI